MIAEISEFKYCMTCKNKKEKHVSLDKNDTTNLSNNHSGLTAG